MSSEFALRSGQDQGSVQNQESVENQGPVKNQEQATTSPNNFLGISKIVYAYTANINNVSHATISDQKESAINRIVDRYNLLSGDLKSPESLAQALANAKDDNQNPIFNASDIATVLYRTGCETAPKIAEVLANTINPVTGQNFTLADIATALASVKNAEGESVFTPGDIAIALANTAEAKGAEGDEVVFQTACAMLNAGFDKDVIIDSMQKAGFAPEDTENAILIVQQLFEIVSSN